jgi:hypothetical protein
MSIYIPELPQTLESVAELGKWEGWCACATFKHTFNLYFAGMNQ